MHCATDSVSWSLAIIRESVLVPGMSQETARQISRLKQFPRFAPEGKILHQYWLALEAITGSTDAIYPHSATPPRWRPLGRVGAALISCTTAVRSISEQIQLVRGRCGARCQGSAARPDGNGMGRR
jgi:hypothetical protein